MLAVAGDFGTFATGYLQTTGYDWAVKFDPTAGSSVSPLQSMNSGTTFLVGSTAAAARAQRALAYISPDLGGVTVAVNYSTDTGLAGLGLGNLLTASNTPGTKISATMLSATYTGGPLSVGGVYASTSPSDSASKTLKITDVALGASYDLSVVKLFGTYQTTKNDTAGAQSDKAMSFSAVAPVGPGAVLFSYAKSTLGTTTSGGSNVNKNGSGYTVGYLQGLSKLTTAYATISKVSNGSDGTRYGVDNNAVAGGAMKAGGSSTMLAVGLNKKF
jgi:hypothetical protein